jgi:hypothetical protein
MAGPRVLTPFRRVLGMCVMSRIVLVALVLVLLTPHDKPAGWQAKRAEQEGAKLQLGHAVGSGDNSLSQMNQAYGQLPLSFEPNVGQASGAVKFLSRGGGYTLYLTGDEAVLALKKSEVRSQKPEVRRKEWKLEIGNWNFETRHSPLATCH